MVRALAHLPGSQLCPLVRSAAQRRWSRCCASQAPQYIRTAFRCTRRLFNEAPARRVTRTCVCIHAGGACRCSLAARHVYAMHVHAYMCLLRVGAALVCCAQAVAPPRQRDSTTACGSRQAVHAATTTRSHHAPRPSHVHAGTPPVDLIHRLAGKMGGAFSKPQPWQERLAAFPYRTCARAACLAGTSVSTDSTHAARPRSVLFGQSGALRHNTLPPPPPPPACSERIQVQRG